MADFSTRYLALYALICGVLLAAAFYFGAATTREQIRFFSAALSRTPRAETVTLSNGRHYEVVGGAVRDERGNPVSGFAELPALQLAYRAAVARTHPLLSIAGTDPDALERSVEALAHTQEHIALLQSTPAKRALVAEALYPIRYLRTLADAERARKDFLDDGTPENAEAYVRAQRAVLIALQADMTAYSRALRAALYRGSSAFVQPRLQTFNGTYGPDSLLEALRQASVDIDSMAALIARREACLRGAVARCDISDLDEPSIAARAAPTHAADPIVGEVREIYAQAMGADVASYTVYATAETACRSPESAAGYYAAPPGGTGFSPVLPLDDIYFMPIDPTTSTYNMYSYSQGLRHSPYRAASYYHCLVSDVINGRILGVDDVVRAVRGDDELRQIAEPFFDPDAPLIADSDVISFLNEALRTGTTLPPQERDHLRELSLALVFGSARLDVFVDHVVRNDASLAGVAALGFDDAVDAEFLLAIKGGFPTLFSFHNPSVFVHSPELFFPEAASGTFPFLRYSKGDISADASVHALKQYSAFHAWLDAGALGSFSEFERLPSASEENGGRGADADADAESQ